MTNLRTPDELVDSWYRAATIPEVIAAGNELVRLLDNSIPERCSVCRAEKCDWLREALRFIRDTDCAGFSGGARQVADEALLREAAASDSKQKLDTQAGHDRLREELTALADHHHRTVVNSKLHDPETISDFYDCPCQPCKRAAAALEVDDAELVRRLDDDMLRHAWHSRGQFPERCSVCRAEKAEAEHDGLREQLNEAEHRQALLERELAGSRERNSDFHAERNRLHEQLDAAEAECEGLAVRIDEVEASYRVLKVGHVVLAECDRLRKRLDEAEGRAETNRLAHHKLHAVFRTATAERDRLREENDYLNEQAIPQLEAGSDRLREALRTVDVLEDALARYFADRDIPMGIQRAVDAFEIARRKALGEKPWW